MKRYTSRAAYVLMIAAAVGGTPVTRAQEDAVPIENLRLPIEHYPDGTVKTQLTAGLALMGSSGMMTASNVVFTLFRSDGSVDAVIHAEDCRYDKEAKTAESESSIRIERSGVTISGKGFEWRGDQERVRILSLAKVRFKRNLAGTSGMFQRARKE